MATKRAKTLDDMMFARCLIHVASGEHGLRDQVMLLLSYKSGLRAAEIAGLEWTDVCDADGNVRTDFLFVPGDIAKRGYEREVPMHPHLLTALIQLRMSRPKDQHVLYGTRDGKRFTKMSPNAVTIWFFRLYAELNLDGCSSHSGRRTFITRLARKAGAHECSTKDVMMLAGHRSMRTTEAYIDLSPHVRRLVAAI